MQPRSDFAWLLLRLAPSKWRVGLGLLCVTLAGIAVTIDPLLMRTLIDKALPERSFRWAVGLAAGIGVCYLARSALYGLGSLINFSISQQCVRDLRVALLEQMNRLSADYHERTPTGEKLTRIEHDVDEIANLGADTANQSIRALLFFVLNLAMMARLSLPMTLTILPLLPLFAVIQRKFSVLLKARANAARTEVGSATSILNEHLGAVPQIQFLGAEDATARRAVSVWDGMLRAQWAQRRTQIAFSLSISAILVSAILLVLAIGSAKVLGGALTIGGLVAFYAYVTRVFEPISSAMDLYARLQSVGASIHRVREVLTHEPSVQDTGTLQLAPSDLTLGLEMKSVSFFYENKPILDNLELAIGVGEHLAIIGASGSGKSTLARLLVRTADPSAGSIFLGGRPLPDYTLASLRRNVCYVPQHPVLFQGTIRENLLYANPNATLAELGHALAVAQFAQVLATLPQGFDTTLGPGAGNLSGGERQRLAIARSLLRPASILVLDEATSALDAPTERALLSSIVDVSGDRTLIVISHRLSSLAWVDRFILLGRGRIIGSGKHEQLYAQSSIYRSLFDASIEDTLDVSETTT
jgi:ABC-type bacteriocin/lantibiotic exporter with double-glycine peptidase domain